MSGTATRGQSGFALLELVAVLATLAVLAALLAAAVDRARASGQRAACASNLRQLFLANAAYATEHGSYAPAAPDLLGANRVRWHGARAGRSSPFDGRLGPLAPYLENEIVRRCPAFAPAPGGFEAACGGYGYNIRGVGSRVYLEGFSTQAMAGGMSPGAIREPAGTVMFCDAAFAQPYDQPDHLIEYSFAEAYYFVDGRPPRETGVATPSIHFRHSGRANVVWCDGHITAERMSFPEASQRGRFAIGWFGPTDNSLFDPR